VAQVEPPPQPPLCPIKRIHVRGGGGEAAKDSSIHALSSASTPLDRSTPMQGQACRCAPCGNADVHPNAGVHPVVMKLSAFLTGSEE